MYRICLDCYCDDEITDDTQACPHCGGTFIVAPFLGIGPANTETES